MLPFTINGLIAAAIGSAVVSVANSTNKEHQDAIYDSEVFSKVPEKFLKEEFPITLVADVLKVNVETLRRRIRTGNLNITNKDTVGGRTGYAIAGIDFINMARELSKQDRLSEFLHLNYNVKFDDLLKKANDTNYSIEVNTDFIDTSDFGRDIVKLEKELLLMEIELCENKIKILSSKIEAENKLEEKIQLMDERVELQKNLIAKYKLLGSY